MHRLLGALVFLALTGGVCAAEDQQTSSTGLIFSDTYRDYLLESQFSLKLDTVKQEQIEVTAPEYPGLQIELTSLKERLKVDKPSLFMPTHSPSYYQNGGQILSYWGLARGSGQLFSVSSSQIDNDK